MPKLPGVNHLNAVRALEKAGLRIARQGKHIVMTNDAGRIVADRPFRLLFIGRLIGPRAMAARSQYRT